MMNPKALSELLDALKLDVSLFARDGRTFCNVGVTRVASAYGYIFAPDTLANDMIKIMRGDRRWTNVFSNGTKAHYHACAGGLAVAAIAMDGHGHVACVAPSPMCFSGSLGRYVPMIMNVGKNEAIGGHSQYCRVSQAFPVAHGEPEYFLLDVEHNSQEE